MVGAVALGTIDAEAVVLAEHDYADSLSDFVGGEQSPAAEQTSEPLSIDEVWATINDSDTHAWLTKTVARNLPPALDPSVIDEIVDEVCLTAGNRALAGQLAPKEGLRSWLYHSAYRAAQNATRGALQTREVSLEALAETPGQHETLLTDNGTLEQRLVTKLAVEDALGQLSVQHQESLDLWQAGQSNAEMAAVLGIRPDKAGRRLQLAQRLFRHAAPYLDLV